MCASATWARTPKTSFYPPIGVLNPYLGWAGPCLSQIWGRRAAGYLYKSVMYCARKYLPVHQED